MNELCAGTLSLNAKEKAADFDLEKKKVPL